MIIRFSINKNDHSIRKISRVKRVRGDIQFKGNLSLLKLRDYDDNILYEGFGKCSVKLSQQSAKEHLVYCFVNDDFDIEKFNNIKCYLF